MRRFSGLFISGMILLFALGALNRLLTDKSSPGIISGFFNAISGLFSNTINS